MWTFEYDPVADKTTVKWREYEDSFSGEISSKVGGLPASDNANEAVNSLLRSINSIPEGLEATQEFRPGMVEYTTVDTD